jgi:Kef-type K+ transport system membrane component KefB
MEILYILLVLLIVTRFFGELAERLGQPALLGELISGIVLGQIVHHYSGFFPVLAGLTEDHVFTAVTDLGIFFLMLLGGIELQPRDLIETSGSALAVALGGMAVPFGLGLLLGWLVLPPSEYHLAQTLFLGTALSITAVPVAIKVLIDLGQLESRVGRTIVSAAVLDDILSLVLLAALTAVIRTGSIPDPSNLLLLAGKVAAFFVVAVVLGLYLFPAVGRLLKRTRADEFEFSMLLVAALAYAVLAESLGMHFILGAFIAGLFFGRRTIDRQAYQAILERTRGLTTGFFAPIFFASIGLHLDLSALANVPGMVGVLVLIAILGKVLGAGAAALPFGFSMRQAFAVGAAMNARGAVELVVADIALRAGIFSVPKPLPPEVANLFSAVVIMAIVTTLVTPGTLKMALKRS